MQVHLALSTSFNGPDFITTFGYMVQDAGTRAIMPAPCTVIFAHHRVHQRHWIGDTGFYWHPWCFFGLTHMIFSNI
jgi:hypothetical protein